MGGGGFGGMGGMGQQMPMFRNAGMNLGGRNPTLVAEESRSASYTPNNSRPAGAGKGGDGLQSFDARSYAGRPQNNNRGQEGRASPQRDAASMPAVNAALPKRLATALHDYTPTEDGQVALAEGDTIDVESVEEDWAFGRNTQSGESGWMPSTYIEIRK